MTILNQDISSFDWGQSIQLPSSRQLRTTTHIIGGRYPCRSIALVPRMILSEFRGKKSLSVLDPFMGSGTTAVEAISIGFRAFGLEVDPFARLISEVSVHGFTEIEIRGIKETNTNIVNAFPKHKPDRSLAPNTNNIEYWFDECNFGDLLKLKSLIIHECINSSLSVKQFFLSVFADIVRAASKAERQSLKPYISKKYKKKRNDVFAIYTKSFSNYINAIHAASDQFINAKIRWLDGDATNFSTKEKIDVAITSPPYINAMDYVRCIKLESAWIDTGDDLVFSEVRSKQLGEAARVKQKEPNELVKDLSRPHLAHLIDLDQRRFHTAMSYFQDMHDNLVSVHTSLKKDAIYHIIVGNSVIRSKEVETHKVIAEIAESIGYSWDGYFNYPIKDHRLSLPRNGNGGKIAVEHVISLRKG